MSDKNTIEQHRERVVSSKDFSPEQNPEQKFSTEEVKELFEKWQPLKEEGEKLHQEWEQSYTAWFREHDESKKKALADEANSLSVKGGELQRQRIELREKLKETKDADGFPTPEAWIEIAADLEQEKNHIPLEIQYLKEERERFEYQYDQFKQSRSQRTDLSPEQFQEYVSHGEEKLLKINADVSSLSQRFETIERMLKEGRLGKW
jgi:hypothetical protein